jgi:hypothetical protein
VIGATLDSVDTKYVTGVQAFWSPPLEGLPVGGTVLRASIDFELTLDPATTAQLIMLGLVPPDFDGKLVVSQRPDTLWIASAEYAVGGWLFAAEYSRWLKRQRTSLPALIPTFHEDAERFYVMVNRQLTPRFAASVYASVDHLDADDRLGEDQMKFAKDFYAFQRDLAVSLRFDVNDHWLWKLEGHFIDGTAGLPPESVAQAAPDRYWGLLLLRTTMSF